MKMETAAKLADACRAAAEKKTLYVYGAYGLPLTEENKQRIRKGYAYNRKPERQEKVERALQLARLFRVGKRFLKEWEG